MCWNIIQRYLFVYHSQCLLYCLISTVIINGCTVLTLRDRQLAVPSRSFVLENYSVLFVCLSQLMFVILPYIYC